MKRSNLTADDTAALIKRWQEAWPQALASWSKYTRLTDPRLCTSRVEAAGEGLTGSFAMIRLLDQSVVINLEKIAHLGLQDYGREILAHEIGHHVLAPASARDQFRLLARIRRGLPTLEHQAAMVANLYTDLYINDRLQRQAGLRMADIYRLIARNSGNRQEEANSVWVLYMRIYEHLWKLDKGSLSGPSTRAGIDTDAWLGARLIRVYAADWMTGAGRFATLILPYLVKGQEAAGGLEYLQDTRDAAAGCVPSGAQEVEDDEVTGNIHPVDDPAISGLDGVGKATATTDTGGGAGQMREPFEYGEILKASGIVLSDHDIAIRYYRERALPHLVSFPVQRAPRPNDPEMEGAEPWEMGDPIDDIDWMQSLIQSPRPIPGMTTMRRAYGSESEHQKKPTPVDLDLYVDSSGSMPNPQSATSYLALAGAIIALSALKARAAVQVTLWSGTHQVKQTRGFVTDSDAILRVLTGYYGGGTAFPIHKLRETYAGAVPRARPTHILMISDDGITTMFDKDEQGNSGWDIQAKALAAGKAGGTMALNIQRGWDINQSSGFAKDLRRAITRHGWRVHAIEEMKDLVAFARAFSRQHYQKRGDQ